MRINLLLSLSIACVLFSTKLKAQDTVFYSVRFSNAVHHESEISITYENVKTPFVRLAVSSFSPGRYANHEFEKNIYGVRAFSAADEPLEVSRIRPNEWLVKVVDGYVKVNYTLFANRADGTYSGIDREFVHLNIPSAFLWAIGTENTPIKLSLHFPDKEWRVATQLKEIVPNEVYFAPGFRYFIDSPVVIGHLSSCEVYRDPSAKISLYVNSQGSDSVVENYSDMIRKVVLEQGAVFGQFPDFEFDEYKFLCRYGEGVHPDGMEHRNSAVATSAKFLRGNETEHLLTLAHEFFHSWNTERLRPRSLEPFNLVGATLSGELWFAEGFTTYYAPLSLKRSGIYTDSIFLGEMQKMINYVRLSPGTGKFSPVEMSGMASLTDASSFNDPTNFQNNFTSYYQYGAVLALALDLELQSRFNKSLDGYMKLLWDKYGVNEIPYSNHDLKNELSVYTDSPVFAQQFFDKYVFGMEIPDLKKLLLNAGFEWHENSEKTDLLRFRYAYDEGSVVFKSAARETSTFYVAGVNQNDKILSINGRIFHSLEDFLGYLAEFNPGQKMHVVYSHHGKEYEAMTLAKPDFSIRIIDLLKDDPAGEIPDSQRRFRDQWLSSRLSD